MILQRWNKHLEHPGLSGRKDSYFSEEYHRLNATASDMPEAFVYESGGEVMVFPFLSRITVMSDGTRIKDFESAYGYGGPLYSSDNEEFIRESLQVMFREMTDAGYIAGFVRFHPLLDNRRGFDSAGQLIFSRNTVAIDLLGEEKEIWMNEIHTKNRNVIKKGEKSGLVFTADYEFNDLDTFKRLYFSTMDKLSADRFYYFNDEYFSRFRTLMPQSFIGTVKLDNRAIAAAIFFFDGRLGHYHLAGSDPDFLRYSPNNFLLWNAAMELKRNGVELFHLGGGTDGSENNSLLQFKQKFSKHLQDFYIGKMIFNETLYNSICENWARRNPEKEAKYGALLLKYRY